MIVAGRLRIGGQDAHATWGEKRARCPRYVKNEDE